VLSVFPGVVRFQRAFVYPAPASLVTPAPPRHSVTHSVVCVPRGVALSA
jgi:hypothetical protein